MAKFPSQIHSGLDIDWVEFHVHAVEDRLFDVEVERAPRSDTDIRRFGPPNRHDRMFGYG